MRSVYEYNGTERLQKVVPRARLCTLNVSSDLHLDTGLLEEDGAGFTSAGGGILYRAEQIPWPPVIEGSYSYDDPMMEETADNEPLFYENGLGSLPPHASALAVAVDPPSRPGGPIAYHVLLRAPLFPSRGQHNDSDTAKLQERCYEWVLGKGFSDGPLEPADCPSLTIQHVFAVYSFEVRFGLDPSVDPATGEGARLVRPPLILRRWELPWVDNWIIQNERPTIAGPGIGLMECKFVEGEKEFSFVVCPDEIISQFRPDYSPSLLHWHSVPTAVYANGALYFALEEHVNFNTDRFSMDPYEDFLGPEPARRLSGDAARAPESVLYHVANADAPVLQSGRLAFTLPGGIRGGYALTDYTEADDTFELLKIQQMPADLEPSMLKPEGYIVLWAASPCAFKLAHY
eukprot:tig00000269_g23757.t1